MNPVLESQSPGTTGRVSRAAGSTVEVQISRPVAWVSRAARKAMNTSLLIKAADFLAQYALIDPTAPSRFKRRPDAARFEGLRVIQREQGLRGKRGSACFLLRDAVDQFLARKRHELEEPLVKPVAMPFDVRVMAQSLRDRGLTQGADELVKIMQRRQARAAGKARRQAQQQV